MRILILNWKDITHPAVGGAEVYIYELANHWVAAGHKVTIFSSSSSGQMEDGYVDGIRVIRSGNRASVYRRARTWYDLEGKGSFDVVLDTVNTRPFLAPLWVKDCPVVGLIFQVAKEVWFREVPFPAATVGRYILEPRWLRSYATVPVLTISESSRQSLIEYGLKNVSVPVGWSEPKTVMSEFKETVPTAIFVGRLASNKRPDDAIRAFVKARRSRPEAKMWVVGTGPRESRLRRMWEPKGIEFFGRVSDDEKFDLLARAHVLLVTSVREGWGLVVTEAAAVGTPSIGYDVPGLRDSVRSANGMLVSPTVDALADALDATVMAPAPKPWSVATEHAGVDAWHAVAAEVLLYLQKASSCAVD